MLGEQGSRQLSAFVCIHQPDGFKDLFAGDFCCCRLFILPGLGCCRGQVLGVEVCFDLLGQFQPGLVLFELFKPCQQFFLYPMQMVMRFSRCGAGFDNKKSPHNNLNLTIPSGMALVRVCYVAIRKSKTCSGSFRSRVGTLSKYAILNCWSRLPQKSSRVNVNLSGRGPSILLRKTVLSLKSPTGAFIAPLRCANANF